METCPIKVCAANGVSVNTLGMSNVTIHIGDEFKTDFMFIVFQHTNIPVLGMDWMATNATGWDFGSGHMSIQIVKFKLQSAASFKSCRKLVATRKNIIAPWSQVVIEGRVESNDLKCRQKTTWITRPRLLLLNSSDKQVVLDEDICLAHLELVELCDEITTCDNKGVEVMRLKVVEPTEEDTRPEFIEDLMNSVHGDVPGEVKLDLERLIIMYSDIFSRSEFDLGKTPLGLHRIDTGDARPVRQTLRRQAYDLVPRIDAYVEGMCKAGIIEPSSSPWASNLVVVKKKDGTYRYCVDYRKLNSQTKRDAYPLPRIDACLDTLSGFTWFSTFDLRASYHQVPMHPDDANKTSFVTRTGTYKFKRVPFGLCNAGSTFQRVMDLAVRGMNFDLCLVYLDDIVVFK